MYACMHVHVQSFIGVTARCLCAVLQMYNKNQTERWPCKSMLRRACDAAAACTNAIGIHLAQAVCASCCLQCKERRLMRAVTDGPRSLPSLQHHAVLSLVQKSGISAVSDASAADCVAVVFFAMYACCWQQLHSTQTAVLSCGHNNAWRLTEC